MAKNGNIHPTRVFRTPDELERAFEFYKEDLIVQAGSWQKVQYVGKEGQRMSDDLKLPYTMEGFSVFCYKNYGVIHQYFKNQDGLYSDFMPICSHIKEEIRSNQITGGMTGVFNTSITQRLNSLVEKIEDVTPVAPKKIIVKIKRDENNTP
jgi:hypothetical protein